MAIILYAYIYVYKKTHIQSVYIISGRKLTRLKCYYKFISTKIIIFASSDDIDTYSGDEISKYGLQYIYIYI